MAHQNGPLNEQRASIQNKAGNTREFGVFLVFDLD